MKTIIYKDYLHISEMFYERTGIQINRIVILVVTEDGTVQQFIKDKKDYLLQTLFRQRVRKIL